MSRKEKKLNHLVCIRLDDGLFERICNECRNAKSEYIRKQLERGKVTVRQEIIAEVPELKRLIAEFGKIGSNLNQIAHHFNTGGAHTSYMYQETQKALSALYVMKYEVEAMGGEFRDYSEARLHKNGDYGEARRYLLFEHHPVAQRPIRDEDAGVYHMIR